MDLLKLLFGRTSRRRRRRGFSILSLFKMFGGSGKARRWSGRVRKGTVDYNAFKMRKKYPTTRLGFFGIMGKNKTNKKSPVRVVKSKNQFATARDFYLRIGKGGTEKRLSNGHGVRKIMKDKGLVVYRPKTSTKESPAIDLSNMNGFIKNQKIHFIKGEND